MDTTTAIDQLVQYLLTTRSTGQLDVEKIEQEIADNPAAIADLALLSTAFNDEPSMLEQEVAEILAHQADLLQLDAYVEADILGEDAAQQFPTIQTLIRENATFRQIYQQRLQAAERAADELFPDISSNSSFAERYQQVEVVDEPIIQSAVTESLWQQLQSGVNRFLIDIPIWLEQHSASFGKLMGSLEPQLMPAGTFRSRGAAPDDGKAVVALVEIPQDETNQLIKLWLGPVENGVGTLILELVTIDSAEPLGQVRISLRDVADGLLERTSTDEQGRAYFRQLRPGKYWFTVDQNEFSVSLTAAPKAAEE